MPVILALHDIYRATSRSLKVILLGMTVERKEKGDGWSHSSLQPLHISGCMCVLGGLGGKGGGGGGGPGGGGGK